MNADTESELKGEGAVWDQKKNTQNQSSIESYDEKKAGEHLKP